MDPLRMLGCLGLIALPMAASGQDSVVVLPPIGVTATRLPSPNSGTGLGLTTLTGDSARRGGSFSSLEELLRFVPGVFAADRGDATVDQQITIRGSGARANFGIRGIRVLVDGVPATLPDGQTQIGALIPADIQRVEVVRGPLGALHGNASSGVIAIETSGIPDSSELQAALVLGGRGRFDRFVSAAANLGRDAGLRLARSATRSEGSRAHSAAEQETWTGTLGWRFSRLTSVTLRAGWLRMPFSESPGALTAAQFNADPHQAAARNLRLNSGQTVSQRQLALGVRHRGGGFALGVHAWMLARTLENPIAAPAPDDPSSGVWIDLDRSVQGFRTDLVWRAADQLTLSGGVDWQQMQDDRGNREHAGRGPVGTPFVDQREQVSELGPFLQGQLRIAKQFTLAAGVRHDRTNFTVADRLSQARSGTRTMAATTGSMSLAWTTGAWQGWLGYGGGFETPTTTELTNRADNATGLNNVLDPARTASLEAGIIHSADRIRLELAAWTSRVTDAILPAAEVDGRSLFHNVDRTTSRGLEVTASAGVSRDVSIRGTATLLDSRFGQGVTDAAGGVIGGNRLPGVPQLSGTIGAVWRPGAWTLDLDHRIRSRTIADDHGDVRAPNWGLGVTDLQFSRAWHRVDLHLSVQNLFDRNVVGAVIVNAAGGRFIQPLQRRLVSVGVAVRIGQEKPAPPAGEASAAW